MKRFLLLLMVLLIVLIAIAGCQSNSTETFAKKRMAERARRFAEAHPDCWEVHCNEFICWCAE